MSAFEITDALLAQGVARPVVNHHPLPRYAMADQDYGMTIGVALTHGGRKFVCWVGGGDSPKAFFLLSYSDAGSELWTEPCLVIDPHDPDLPCDRCTIVGTLWVDPLNRLWLFFNQSLEHCDGRGSNWYIRCDRPDNEALVWTEPEYLYHGCTLNKPIILPNGEWMLPISVWQRHHISAPFKDCFHDLDPLRMAHVFVSADQGRIWTRRGGVAFPNTQFDEHMMVSLWDGRLWMLGRTKNGLMESFSSDAGITWTEPARSRVQSVSARFHIRRLPSGAILLIKHGREVDSAPENRSWLTAFLSDDDGQTWTQGLVLDERFEISYPDADIGPDGMIYITYDRNRKADGEILMAALREADIRAGRVHTCGAFLRRVIRKPGRLIRP